jgi:hypothetical protein
MESIGRAFVGLAVAAVVLAGAGASPLAGSRAWAAAPTAGAEITDPTHSPPIPLNSGGSHTIFSVSLPTGAACSQDTAHGRYHVYGYIVSSTTDPGALTWDSNGPVLSLNPPDTDSHTLYDTTGAPYAAINTAITTGQVPQAPNLNWVFYTPTGNGGTALTLPASTTGITYNVGIACVTDSFKTDKFWNVSVKFSTSTSDPNGETWAVTGAGSGGAGATATSTILGTSPTSEAAPGAAVTLTATVSCTSPSGATGCPSSGMGSVQFFDGTNSLSTATVSAAAGASTDTGTITTTTLASGTHSLKATFNPTVPTQFTASTSPAVQFTILASATTTTTTTPAATATTVPGGTPGGFGTTTTTPGGATPLADQSGSGSADSAGTTSSSSPDAPASSGLPVTGAASLTSAGIGVFLVAVGLAVVTLTRRRRSRGRRSRLA